MKKRFLLAGAAVAALAVLVPASFANRARVKPAAAQPATVTVATEIRTLADASLAKGAAFLLGKQLPDGSWMQHPAITALAAMSLAQAPDAKGAKTAAAVNRALDFVVKFAQADGSIWNPKVDESPNYTTSIVTLALAQFNRPQDVKILRSARDYLLGSQFKDGDSDGGIGYGKTKRADLSNTQWALEALKATEQLDREPECKDPEKAKQSDLAWDKAIGFISRCQNLKETNDQAWVSTDPKEKGGFVYLPGDSKAGTGEDGQSLRSYGSMTYAGLKSMLYAKLSKDDPRVKAATEWIRRNYTFDENPGMKSSGLYYYIHTGTKALAVLGENTITDEKGVVHDWRAELVRSLAAKQKPGGEWSNSDGRWMESIPELSTCYSMIALGVAVNGSR